MIHLVGHKETKNVTVFDGPLLTCRELTGMMSFSFQILIRLLVHDVIVNICYEITAAPENLIFSDIHITAEIVPIYRVYNAPHGFEIRNITITGFRGEACNLGGVVFLKHDDRARWDAIGPYCDISFSDISMQNNFRSGVVIYSYGAMNISLNITSSTKKSEHFLIPLGPGNSPFIAEVDGYRLKKNIKKLTILPKPWNYENNDAGLMLLHFATIEYAQKILFYQLITISHSSVSKSTVTNAYPKGRNFTEESCSLTLHATAYIRLLFRTGVKGIAPVWPFDLFKCIHNTFFTKD